MCQYGKIASYLLFLNRTTTCLHNISESFIGRLPTLLDLAILIRNFIYRSVVFIERLWERPILMMAIDNIHINANKFPFFYSRIPYNNGYETTGFTTNSQTQKLTLTTLTEACSSPTSAGFSQRRTIRFSLREKRLI